MQIIYNLQVWQTLRRTFAANQSLGFVPTMGNLHKGHQSLFEICRKENDLSVVSIFINPTQFNNTDDFKLYPKTLEADLDLLRKTGVDYCLLPDTHALYPEGYRFRIEETQTSLELEGLHRPGHFNGVLTIVMILLQLVKPHRSYFGEKDYQQYQLIRGMTKAFFLDTEIIPCPTIRDTSGLAFSSRNNRLTPQDRALADKFAEIFHKNQSCDTIKTILMNLGVKVDYVEDKEQRRFAAVYIGDIRLIDNYPIV
jgi:pantoate--beta-alanine ligase